jgi:hypothetical protein
MSGHEQRVGVRLVHHRDGVDGVVGDGDDLVAAGDRPRLAFAAGTVVVGGRVDDYS